MGVQGFTPFLQKTVPHIIHKLPNRLRDLAGKKLVIDGTLITQRLHFAPSPHPFRHVLGWYNLAREFSDNNISAVCIFDGNLRTKAKALELGRREASRRLHVSRGTLESVRMKRLQKLQSVMANVRTLDEKGKSAIAEMLSRLNVNDGTGTVGAVEGLNRVGQTLRVLSGAATPSIEERPVKPEQEQEREQEQVVFPTTPLTREEEHVEEQEATITPETEPNIVEPSPVEEQPQHSKVIGFGTPALGVPASVTSAEDIRSVILSSYRDFRSSISKIASLSLPEREPKVPAPVTFIPTEETDTQEEDLVLSKTQCELTLEEGRVWDELTLATSPVVEPAPTPDMPLSIPELPPTSPPLEVPPPTVDLPPSIAASLEPPPTFPPLETPPAAALPPSVPGAPETPSPAPEAETETPPAAAVPTAIPASLEPPFSPPETPSPAPEIETETPPTAALPTTVPIPLEPPYPPPETPYPGPETEIETTPTADLPTTVPTPLEPPSPPPETPSPGPETETEIPSVAALPTSIPTPLEPPSPSETPFPGPETETETPSAATLPATISAPLEPSSLPPEIPLTAAVPISTPPPPEVEKPKPEPTIFTFDHLVLSAAEDRLDALASRSEIVADSYQRRTCVPTRTTYMESREILEAMGVPCFEVQGEHEGEGVASSLVLEGMADYVVSEDTDVLVYGAPIIRNITSHINPLTLIHGNDVREALGLSNDAYIDFAILLGTDFSQRIRNVGPTRALKFIKEYETIENILDGQSKYQPTIPYAQYMAQVESARAIFSSPPPIPSQLRLAAMSTGTELVDQAKVAVVMERCGLGRALVADSLWNYEAALDGNYFSDNPSTIVS